MQDSKRFIVSHMSHITYDKKCPGFEGCKLNVKYVYLPMFKCVLDVIKMTT